MPPADAERLLIDRVRSGDQAAWRELIAQYEGRLIAFAESRLGRRAAAEDVVQETFLGFLVSLPNYDSGTPLESYLFSIAAHKLTDALRRSGRRPTLPLVIGGGDSEEDYSPEPAGRARRASSIARSSEGRTIEAQIVAECLSSLAAEWKQKGDWERLKCLELLFVLGLPNKEAATRLNLSEQAVANHKQFVVQKLKAAAAKAKLRDFSPAALGIEES